MGKVSLEKIIIFAATKHRGQVDKEGESYIFHPLRVMARMKTKDEQIVAVLHDILEDTDATVEDLRRLGVSTRLIRTLQTLTRKENEDYLAYIDRVKKDKLARRIKMADLADNLDPRRLKRLKKDVQERLKKKYTAALRCMRSAR